MKNSYALLVAACLLLGCPLFSQTPPFTLEIEEATYSDWPGLHSFAFGEWDGKWVIMAGRINGLHGFFSFTAFPESSANANIWVMDVKTGDTWSFDVNNMPDPIAGPLLATNPQFVQQGKYLYIIGGYGKNTGVDDFITWSSLLAVDLETLVPAIINGGDPEASFRVLNDERLRVCGGEMHELGEDLYLVGGHNFGGLYSSNGVPTFTQTYTQEIRKFRIADNGVDLSIQNYQAFQHPEYHRRDMNMAPTLRPDGQKALAVFGGVFQPNRDLPYQHPIFIDETGIEVDESYFQQMCQYTCPVLPIFEATRQEMHHVFFGGISLHSFDENSQTLQPDSLMPFINDIALFTKTKDGASSESVLPVRFDALLGSNAKFVFAEDAPVFDNKVLKMNDLQDRTLAGYIFGGIQAVIPNVTPSSSSNRLFKVYVTPSVSATEESLTTVPVSAYPNPFSDEINLSLPAGFLPEGSRIFTTQGQLVWQNATGKNVVRQSEEALKKLEPGIYYLEMRQGENAARLKLVRI